MLCLKKNWIPIQTQKTSNKTGNESLVKILLIRTAKGKQKWADTAVENWKKRFSSKLSFSETVLKPAAEHHNIERRRELEYKNVQKILKMGDRIIVLDERGDLWTTEELHQHIQKSMNDSVKRLVFQLENLKD